MRYREGQRSVYFEQWGEGPATTTVFPHQCSGELKEMYNEQDEWKMVGAHASAGVTNLPEAMP